MQRYDENGTSANYFSERPVFYHEFAGQKVGKDVCHALGPAHLFVAAEHGTLVVKTHGIATHGLLNHQIDIDSMS